MKECCFIDGVGVIFFDKEIKKIYTNLIDKEESMGPHLLSDILPKSGIEPLIGFTGISEEIGEDGEGKWVTMQRYEDDTVYWYPFGKQPNILKSRYTSLNEMKEEFDKKFPRMLSEDFEFTVSELCGFVEA